MALPTSFWELVRDAAGAAPERVVLADDHGRSLTTTALRDAAERVAAGLPVRPGMVVSWQLPSTLEACVLMAALARAGAVQRIAAHKWPVQLEVVDALPRNAIGKILRARLKDQCSR